MQKNFGIRHIEFWVSDLQKSLNFYSQLFKIIGWEQVNATAFKSGNTKIYFKEAKVSRIDSIGPRHICFHTGNKEIVDKVGKFLQTQNVKIIRGPMEMKEKEYSKGYYTIDFFDPDGYVIEVAHS